MMIWVIGYQKVKNSWRTQNSIAEVVFRNLWQNMQKSRFKLIFRQPCPKRHRLKGLSEYIYFYNFSVCVFAKKMNVLSLILLGAGTHFRIECPATTATFAEVSDFTENSDACPLPPASRFQAVVSEK